MDVGQRGARGQARLGLGIGIASGEVVAGEVDATPESGVVVMAGDDRSQRVANALDEPEPFRGRLSAVEHLAQVVSRPDAHQTVTLVGIKPLSLARL